MRTKLHIVVAGHVDHGKSTMIGRLLLQTKSFSPQKLLEIERVSSELGKDAELAFVADQLEEERKRGITIDTTQLFFQHRQREYAIIDTPGHVELIRNMLSGASLADAGILIVDAAEGVREQTRRHARLLEFLGLKRIILVVNKLDLVGFSSARFSEVASEARGLFSTEVEVSAAIPISAREGLGFSGPSAQLQWYGGLGLLDALDEIPSPEENLDLPLRFPVQDTYNINGESILVGRVASGRIRSAEQLLLLSSKSDTPDQTVSVEKILVYEGELVSAQCGQNIGVKLAGQAVASRGDVICAPDSVPAAGDCLEGRMFWLAEEPLTKNDSVTVRWATQSAGCKISGISEVMDLSSEGSDSAAANLVRTNEMAKVSFRADQNCVIDISGAADELRRFVVERNDIPAGVGMFSAAWNNPGSGKAC